MARDAEPASQRAFAYRTSLKWERGRTGELQCPVHPTRPALPVDLGGPGDLWTPGELLVGAVEGCTVATLLTLARRSGLPLAGCTSSATGTLEADEHGYVLSSVAVSVHLTVFVEEDRAAASALLLKAHETCFITRSLNLDVTLDYTIEVERVGR